MSLKAFHVVFIAASGLLAAFCAAWAVNQYRADRRASTWLGPSYRLRPSPRWRCMPRCSSAKTRNL